MDGQLIGHPFLSSVLDVNIHKMNDKFFVDLALLLQGKIENLLFQKITFGPMDFDEDFTAVTALFSYKGKEIELCLGHSKKEGGSVSLPQDLKVNYNFRPHRIKDIQNSIERCLENGWINAPY